MVGTPGRLLDLGQQGHLQLGGLSVLVLDEADEMLDLGFLPDIERILRQIPADRQSMLFSATMPDPIITLARTFMVQPTHIRAEAPHSSAATHDTTEQFVYRAHALDKVELVSRILQADGRGATMIFTRTKRTAQKVADELAERGFKVGAVHGDLGQIAREKALKAFRNGDIDVLVATDVAARGIDIDDITHVINYQIPEDEQAYVHRIGRTGRAGKTGIAVTLVDWDELPRWTMIDKALGLDTPTPPRRTPIRRTCTPSWTSRPRPAARSVQPASRRSSAAAPRRDGAAKPDGRGSAAPPAAAHPRRPTGHRTPCAPAARVSPTEETPPRDAAPATTRERPAAPSSPQAGEREPRPPTECALPHGQTRTPHQGRHCGGGDHRRGCGHGRGADLVDQRRPGHDQPPGRRSGAQPDFGQGSSGVPEGALDGRQPATAAPMLVGGTVATGDGRRVDGRDPATGESRWSYCRDTDLCGVSGFTTTRSRSTGTTAVAVRSAPSTGRPAPADPPAAATPIRTCGCPPTARRCCRRAAPGWNCGARTWSGCWPTARPTPG